MMSQYKALYNNTIIFTISNFASKLLGFFMLPLYTRVLSREEFGTADLIILTVGLLIPILTLSISEGVLRFALDEKADKRQVFSYGLKLLFGGYIILLVFLPFSEKIPVIKDYAILFYLIYISQTLNLFFNQFTRAIDKIKLIGIVGVLQTIVTVISNILFLVVFEFGIEGYLISYVLANTSGVIILFFGANLKSYFTTKDPNNRELKKEMLRYCIPLIPNRASWWLNNSSNKYVISGFSGAQELGLFSAASRIPSILITFQGIFVQAWQISAITEFNKDNSIKFFSDIYKLYNFVMVVSCSLLILFVKPISELLFGPQFKDAWILVPFLLISVIFGALVGFLNAINLAFKKTKSLFISVFLGALIGIIINLIFVPKFGAMAASISTTISYLLIWLFRLLETRKFMPLKINFTKDIFTYIFIFIQAIIIFTINTYLAYLLSSVCIIIILIINKNILIKSIDFIKSKFYFLRNKRNNI